MFIPSQLRLIPPSHISYIVITLLKERRCLICAQIINLFKHDLNVNKVKKYPFLNKVSIRFQHK